MSSTLDNARAKAKGVAAEDFDKAKQLVNSAAKSGAYLYPIKVTTSLDIDVATMKLMSVGDLLLPRPQIIMEAPPL
jgi:hypothetical protein